MIPALSIQGLTKTFGENKALDGVSFEVAPGSIHALLGGNGSGKSTTIKILGGVYDADQGEISINGEKHAARNWSPAQARSAGLRFVHQQTSTFPELSVAENLAIGHGFETAAGKVRWRAQKKRAQEILDRFEIDVDPATRLAECRVATQAIVTIARALQDLELGEDDSSRPGVLILDEPTAALPPKEVDRLLGALRGFAEAGQTIIYVTHRLDEVVEIADAATILRDGKVSGTLAREQINTDALIEGITGREPRTAVARGEARAAGEVRLRCRELVGGALRGASVKVRSGEIVALAGLLGSGRSSLLRMVAGNLRREGGEIEVNGAQADFRDTREASREGVIFSPEDRRASAAFLEMSVRENIGIRTADRFYKRGLMHNRAEIRHTEELIDRYQVRAASTELPLSTLSGGNQQKALLARWLGLDPDILLLDEPTQGVDVGAREEIWRLVREAVDNGAAALVVLSDFQELVEFCDRAVVLHRGRTVAEIECDGISESDLEAAVLGVGNGAAQ